MNKHLHMHLNMQTLLNIRLGVIYQKAKAFQAVNVTMHH